MSRDSKIITVKPGSEIDRLLAEISESNIELDRDGVRYRIERIEDDGDSGTRLVYDPERALAGIRAAAGGWADIDVEALKDYLYRARDEGSRPITRP
jgi:hypothetical protein